MKPFFLLLPRKLTPKDKKTKEEMVKNLLLMGMDMKSIQQISGLTEAQINKIKQQKESL